MDLQHEVEVHRGLLEAVFDAGGNLMEQFSAGARLDVLRDYYTALTTFDIVGRLADIAVPCLVVRGRQDCVVDAEAVMLLGRIPGAWVREFPDHGHYVPLTAGLAFNAALIEFLAGQS
jgi:pimeloyl-ACP methyl ester carboxylesterase